MECHARVTGSKTECTFKRGLVRKRLGLFNGSPTKNKQQTFPLWYSPPPVDCLSPHSCLEDRFLNELIYTVIGDFWAPLKEIQSNQAEFGVLFFWAKKGTWKTVIMVQRKSRNSYQRALWLRDLGVSFLFVGIGASRTMWASQLFVPILSHREEKRHRVL